jgi:uncharacterized protein YwqG
MSDSERERSRRAQLHMADLVMQEAPLSFIAQIDLAEVSAAGPLDPDIPSEGRIYLFYDTKEQPWGFRPGDVAGTRLIYDTSPVENLVRQMEPSDLSDERIPPLRCTFSWTLLPDVHSFEAVVDLDEEDHDALGDWSESTEAFAAHRIGGDPTQIQGDMDRQCVVVSHGLDLGHDSPEGAADINVERERQDWIFLFQIASDDKNNMMWGDLGMLYLWITCKDLQALSFENARLIFQCY